MNTLTMDIAPDEISPLTATEINPDPDVWEDWDWDDDGEDDEWWEDEEEEDWDWDEDDEFFEEDEELEALPY